MSKLAPYAKAVAAFVTALAGSYGTAAADGQVTTVEWLGVAATTVVATAAVFGVTNKPAKDAQPAAG